MGKITDRVNEFWSPLDLARAIDTELEALRQELEAIRNDFQEANENQNVFNASRIKHLAQEIQDLKRQCRDWMDEDLKEAEPQAPLPPEQLERGDVISYLSDGSRVGRMKGDKVLGIFHHQDDYDVWAYFQQPNGDFIRLRESMPKSRITLELCPEK